MAKKLASLPESLRYLQPFVNVLAKLPREDLNEDIDASRLESALRKRVRGLDERAAEALLTKDLDMLDRWLNTEPDHPAHWILGYLLCPDLAAGLTAPPEPSPRGPDMAFEAPKGWKVKAVPFRLDLKAGKVIGWIMAIDEDTFSRFQWQREQPVNLNLRRPPGVEETFEVSEVSFEPSHGKKYTYHMTGRASWKQVDYLLRVPGGFVSIGLGTRTGRTLMSPPWSQSFTHCGYLHPLNKCREELTRRVRPFAGLRKKFTGTQRGKRKTRESRCLRKTSWTNES
ncbi:MAG: hypothetical protein ACJ8FY_01295 [Gemmataceae bacterium]